MPLSLFFKLDPPPESPTQHDLCQPLRELCLPTQLSDIDDSRSTTLLVWSSTHVDTLSAILHVSAGSNIVIFEISTAVCQFAVYTNEIGSFNNHIVPKFIIFHRYADIFQ
jgi:hypothetical protein